MHVVGPESVEPPPDAPNFRVVEGALQQGLRERGLHARPAGEKEWETGVPGLRMRLGETLAAKAGEGLWFGHVEVFALLDHPTYGKHLVQDLVSLDAPTGDAVLVECINCYLAMTLDPLRALFDEALFAAPARRLVSVVDPGEATAWNVYTEWLNARGPDTAVLVEHIGERSMLGLIGGTLVRYVAEPKLHWFKLYGESYGPKRQFGCIFDGHADRDGEREMEAQLSLPADSGRWSYRGFAVLVPHGEPDPAVVGELRAQLGPAPAKGRSWWPFGSQKRRISWVSL